MKCITNQLTDVQGIKGKTDFLWILCIDGKYYKFIFECNLPFCYSFLLFINTESCICISPYFWLITFILKTELTIQD